MQKKIKILSLNLLAVSVLLSCQAWSAIYGADNRQDISSVPELRKFSKAVAVAVGKNLLHPNADGSYRLEVIDHMGDWMCKDERFSSQTSIGFCTGFLISDSLLVTAGHCGLSTGVTSQADHPFCTDISWILDYNDSIHAQTDPNRISKDMIVGCKRLIRAETIEADLQGNPGNDFAILELDRKIPSSVPPLRISSAISKVDELAYTLGHPSGMPLKYSGKSRVLRAKAKSYFEINLDTLSGNSGGPVLNLKNEVIGILVSGHPVDYVMDSRMQCQRPNRCNASGSSCAEAPPKGLTQVYNEVQHIQAIMPWLPKTTLISKGNP